MVSLTEISAMLLDFSEDRPSLKENNTPLNLVDLTANEILEVKKAIESGDLQEIGQELADVVIFIGSIANVYGIDLTQEILTKVAYNIARYSAKDFDGSIPYEEARLRGKAREKWVKPMFYNQTSGFTE